MFLTHEEFTVVLGSIQTCMAIHHHMEFRIHWNLFLIVYEGRDIWLYLASEGPESHHQTIRPWQLVCVFLSDLN